jgi:protein required for attachment to host cells
MNEQMLIAVIDHAHARFLTLEQAEISDAGLTLIEHTGLILPVDQNRGPQEQAHSYSPQGAAHTYDDHRQEHTIELERHFAHSIATHMNQIIQDRDLQVVLLVAAHQVLGLMRQALEPVLPKTVKLTEVTKDLCHLSPYEIQEYLAEQEFIPALTRPGIASI